MYFGLKLKPVYITELPDQSCVDLVCDASLLSLVVGHGKCVDVNQSDYSFLPSSGFRSGLLLFSFAGEYW